MAYTSRCNIEKAMKKTTIEFSGRNELKYV